MKQELNNLLNSYDKKSLDLRFFDMDDYINGLHKEIESLKNMVESLKTEIKTQRKEIAALREERRAILNSDKPPGMCINWHPANNPTGETKV